LRFDDRARSPDDRCCIERVVTVGGGPTPRPPQAFTLTTPDGVILSALRYGPVDADIAVVFGHGFTGSKSNRKIVAFARRLAEHGLAVYTADFRGHGASGGLSTLGDQEIQDLESVLVLARRHHRKVVSAGASMGAFIALRHAGLGGRSDAIIAISSPAVGRDPKLLRARLLGRAALSPHGRRLLDLYGTRVGAVSDAITPPLDLIAQIGPVPVAIVHGVRDRYVPLADAYALYNRLQEPRRLVVLGDFGHGEAAFDAEFADRIISLIADLLGER
jgi:alpha-beta hydrolase superfamily lysophospholipase